jgi:hypothetical protein
LFWHANATRLTRRSAVETRQLCPDCLFEALRAILSPVTPCMRDLTVSPTNIRSRLVQ